MLIISMYHYVLRESPRFQGLKGITVKDFRAQIKTFCDRYEMATAESAIAFINGCYTPKKQMMLTSYDDALKEHSDVVADVLSHHRIDGVFAIPTRPLEEGWITPTHKNHLLLGELPVADYISRVSALVDVDLKNISAVTVQNTYRWDTEEVARLKYLINFEMDAETRNRVLDTIFADVFGDEALVAQDFHMNWDDAKKMQTAGLTIAGHSHSHSPIASLADPRADIALNTAILRERLGVAPRIFTFPFGKEDSFGERGVKIVQDLGYEAAFSTIVGENKSGGDPYRMRRLDPKDFKQDGSVRDT